ncbi:Protein of unknown function [Lactobacillus acidophilus CIRM-BIA 445]|nr:Protein of unknown function [Lactobacillus acidophilus CIRM-BIA 445]CDF76307.1 Protein of unknown function [Lactobacillus acidophilus DSM 20242]
MIRSVPARVTVKKKKSKILLH